MHSFEFKVLDFGRVSINSVVAKNFAVTNDLTHSFRVSISDLEPELNQSKPDAQVLPKGAVAGFDIIFCSKVLGKYKKTFTWSINGRHSFKVAVIAEVVPIQLVMNVDKLILAFPEDSLEQTISKNIVLNNPGNAPAEFLWGNAGSFTCKPDKGIIDPGVEDE